MDVAVSAFRAQMKNWIEQARNGQTVVLTERGIPVAKLVGVEAGGLLDELEREGLLSQPTPSRPRAEAAEPLSPRGTPAPGGLARRLRRQG